MTGAARALGLSQPAVSQQIAQLEEKLAVSLFEREKGRLVPTTDGLDLFGEVSRAFENLERVLALAQDLSNRSSTRLRLAVPHSTAVRLVPAVYDRLEPAYPNLKITVELGSYPEIMAMVASRKVDVGVAKSTYSHPGVAAGKLVNSPYVCVLPSDHPLRGRARIGPRDLRGHPLILLGKETMTRSRIESQFAKAGAIPQVLIETHSVGSACAFVEAGKGIALAPALMAVQHLGPKLSLCPFDSEMTDTFTLIVPKTVRRMALVSAFKEEILAEAAREIAEIGVPA